MSRPLPQSAAMAGDVALAAFAPDDVTEEYVGWLNDPEIVRFTEARYQRHTMEGTRHYVRACQASPRDELFRILADGAHVGNIKLTGIDQTHRRCSIGILIGRRDMWGRGIGTQAVALVSRHAFATYGLHKLVAGIYVGNEASRRAFEKAGFHLEATLREHRVFEGRLIDEWLLVRFAPTNAGGEHG